MTSKFFFALVSLLFSCGLSQEQEDAALERGRHLTQLFYSGQVDELWKAMSPQLQGVFGASEAVGAMSKKLRADFGAEAEVLDETVEGRGAVRVYTRKVKYENHAAALLVMWSLNGEGVAVGFQISPDTGDKPSEAPTEFLEYQTKTKLQLPFAKGDEWFVFWGGRTVDINYHAAYVGQRFAYDLLAIKNGATHRGDGKSNEDYYCFNRVIVAPGAGKVITVENSLKDNAPGVMDPANPLGNHVIIDHGNGEFSFMAHFKEGTVRPKVGDLVTTGEAIARTGNSGNTSEPHLHYHLQASGSFGTGGRGLPAQFQGYVSNGKPIARGEPVKGELITSGE